MSVCTESEVVMFPPTITIEEGQRGTYSFNLSTYVTGDSYLAINNAFQGELAVVGRSVYKIVPEDWNQTRTVTIEILDNDDVEGTRNYTMIHDMSSLDPNWMLDPGAVPNVTVIVTDNDSVGIKLDPDYLDLVEFGDFKVSPSPRPLPPCSHPSLLISMSSFLLPISCICLFSFLPSLPLPLHPFPLHCH